MLYGMNIECPSLWMGTARHEVLASDVVADQMWRSPECGKLNLWVVVERGVREAAQAKRCHKRLEQEPNDRRSRVIYNEVEKLEAISTF